MHPGYFKTVKKMQACLILMKYPVGPVMCFTFYFGYRNYGFQVFLTVGNRVRRTCIIGTVCYRRRLTQA